MRPIGTVDTIRAITSAVCRVASGVLIGPGLTTLIGYDGPSDPGSHERADGGLTRGVDAAGGSTLNTRDRTVENDGATIIH